MMNKKRLLFMLCGMLMIPSAPLNVMAMEKEDIKIEAVQTEAGLNIALEDNNAGENEGELSRIVAVKEKSSSKAKKKKKNKRNKKNNKKKNTKKKNSGKKMGKKQKDKKTDKHKKNNKNVKNKKDKKKDMDKKKDIDIKEEDVSKLPETDKYRPELKEKENKNNQNNGGGEIIPPGGGQTETLLRDYVVLCDYTDKKGNLRFKAGNSIALPEKGYIGLKANGENTGKETEIDWSGSSLQNIKNGIKGNYNLTVIPKENIIIGRKDYGKVKFVVNIIVE